MVANETAWTHPRGGEADVTIFGHMTPCGQFPQALLRRRKVAVAWAHKD